MESTLYRSISVGVSRNRKLIVIGKFNLWNSLRKFHALFDTVLFSSINLCLQQVSKCQFFVGFLGERYGYRISDYGRIVDENGLPYDWLKDYPPSASITELEIYKFALSNVHQAKERSFFYFRDPKFMKLVNVRLINFLGF